MRCNPNSPRKVALLLLLLTLLPSAVAQQRADTFLEKGDQYIATGKPSLARVEYEKALKAGAKLDDDFSRSRSLGFAYMNGEPHDFGSAARWLANASRLRPGDEEVHLGLAQSLTWGGRPAEAVAQWRWLYVKNPQNTNFGIGLSNALWASGDQKGCFDLLQHLVETAPSNVDVRLQYARLLGYAKQYSEASVQYQSVLQIDPSNLDAQVGMAKLLSWQQSYDAAVAAYDKVLKVSPRYESALVGKAYTLMWMGRSDEARAIFRTALRQNPRDPEILDPLKRLDAEAERQAKLSQKPITLPPPSATPSNVASSAAVKPPQVELPSPSQPSVASLPITPDSRTQIAPISDPAKPLLAEAEASSNRGDFAKAIDLYRHALALRPGDADISVRLARVLSWDKRYDESLAEYGRVLGNLQQQNLEARLERARVLSWAQKYDDSIREYQAIAVELKTNPVKGISEREVRLEQARVESWARQYSRSLADLDRLIPEKPSKADEAALVLKARVLSYMRRYPESLATYDVVLNIDPSDKDATFGKAQTLYWSGDLRRSRPMLRSIVNDEPGNSDARVTLAAVENGSGDSTRALSLLDTLPDKGEVHTLKTAILQNLRPVLRERFGWENDIEAPPGSQPSTTTRGLRLMSSYEFSLTPRIRMQLSNTVTRGTTSNSTLARYGTTAFAQESMVHITVQPSLWFRLTAGAGVGTTGAGSLCPQPIPGLCSGAGEAAHTQRPVFDLHPVFLWNKLRIDLATSRHIADYTPLAIHDNVAQLRQSVAVSYEFPRVRVGGEYRFLNYKVEPSDLTPALPSDLSANSHGGVAYVTPKLYRGEHLTVEAGMRYEVFGYDSGAEKIAQSSPAGYGTAGFFTPRLYERYAGTGHIAFDLKSRFHLELDGTFGPQRIFGFASLMPPAPKWGTTGTTTIQIRRDMGRFQPYLAYDYFSTATAAGPTLRDGSYSSHSLSGGFSWRF